MEPIIPIIDLSADDATDNIEKALETTGFFYIVNHGLKQEELNSFISVAQRFFSIPQEEKLKIAKIHHFDTGYVEIGAENLQEDRPGVIDYKEAVDFTVSNSHPIYNQNNWPSSELLPDWKENVEDIANKLNQIGIKLVRSFSVSMGKEENYLGQYYKEEPSSLIRFLRYPASIQRNDKSSFVGCGEHTDYGILTILLQDTVGGLQIEYEGKYIDVNPIPGSFVVNVGDCMEYITNGHFKATKHRVINSLPQERHVVVLFYEPNIHMPLKCAQKFSNKNENKYPQKDNMSFGDHLKNKLSATYKY